MDKIDESTIIDYLYDNLSNDERNRIEEAARKDTELKEKIDSMSQLKSVLSEVEDKEVLPPSFIFDEQQAETVSFYQSTFVKRTIAVAASFLLIIMFTSLTGFQLTFTDKGLWMGFGTQKMSQDSKDDIRTIMKQVLAENHVQTDQKMSDLESKLMHKVDESNKANIDSMQKLLTSNRSNSKAILKAYLDQTNKENIEMIQNFFVVSNTQQQQYLKKVLADFNSFYQVQRQNDLKMIETGLNKIQNNNEVKQFETEVVLANLMDMVKVKNK